MSAADVRRHIERLYAQGHAHGDGSIPLDAHALAEIDSGEIRDLAVAERVGTTLEVGLGLGIGTLSLCEALLEVGEPQARHVVIEAFPDDLGASGDTDAPCRRRRRTCVELIHEESQLALGRLAAEGRRFDLALIDGDHRFEGVFVDLYFADRLVRPRGLVIVDDLWMPAIRHAVSYMERNMGWELLPDAVTRGFRWRRPRHLPGPAAARRRRRGGPSPPRTPAGPRRLEPVRALRASRTSSGASRSPRARAPGRCGGRRRTRGSRRRSRRTRAVPSRGGRSPRP